MSTHPRMKMLVVCIGVALAQWGTGSALADSAVGVDMANGNALNPPGRSAVPRPMAEDGFDTVRHSPSGQLYGVPYDRSEEANKTEGGWEYSGGVEAGVLGGDAGNKNSSFRKYKDLNNGAYLNYFEVEADKAGSANYMSSFGGGTGFNDQFYGLQFGRYNDWKVKLFYNETQHVFTSNWKPLFNGEGTGNLTTGLPKPTAVINGTYTQGTTANFVGPTTSCSAAAPCWSYASQATGLTTVFSNKINGYTGAFGNAGAYTGIAAAVNGIGGKPATATGVIPAVTAASAQSGIALDIYNKLKNMPDSELSLVRKKGGARMDKTITDNWKGYASYTQEARTGARPFAMNEGNISTEIAEPIDYTTHEFLGGVQYADALTQANLRASLSMFRNNISTLNVDYPFLSTGANGGAMQTATYDLYPDNNAFNLKGEFARSLPDFYKGRFNATVAWGTSQQDDTLLAPISAAQNAQLAVAGLSGPLATFSPGNNAGYGSPALINNWNTTAALSQLTAKQRIDTTLLDLGLSVKPTDALSMKGAFRFFDSSNKGGYTAYNPLTGQFGRGFADANGLTGLDAVVGLAPGKTPGATGSCYVPPGFPAVPGCTFGAGTWTSAAAGLPVVPVPGTYTNTIVNGNNTPVYGQARSTQQLNYGLAGDYDLSRTSSINAALEREEFTRNFRERDKTWEDKLKLGYVNRGWGNATLRTSFETDSKRGSDYNYRTFEDLGTSLPGLSINTLTGQAGVNAGTVALPANYAALAAGILNRYSYYFRKYDQADRDQNIFNARLNFQAREDLDLGVTFQTKDIKYPGSFYGMDKDKQDSLSLELNYQPSSGKNLYAFYSYQQGQKSMKLNSGTAGANSCTAANLALYGYSACSDTVTGLDGSRPTSATWTSDTRDQNDVLGLGFQSAVGNMQFGVDYTYSSSSTAISYNYGSTAFSGTAATQAAAALIAGSALPNMTFVTQTLNFNLLIPINKKLSVRLYDRFEVGQVKDWHYDDVIKNAAANYDSGTLLLDGGAQNYHANVIGIFIQYKL